MDSFYIIDIQEATFWSPEKSRIVLNGVSFGRCIDDGKHFFEMFLNQLVIVRLNSRYRDSKHSVLQTIPEEKTQESMNVIETSNPMENISTRDLVFYSNILCPRLQAQEPIETSRMT